MSKTYNFCAGPAALPEPVMLRAQQELLDWNGLGVSVMEISHRSKDYQELANKAEKDLRNLLDIGDEFAVLFLQGGASLQFASIPMSLLHSGREAEYVENGVWSKKAAEEAARFGKVNMINAVNIDENGIRSLTDSQSWNRTENPAYTHFTSNETIEGMRFSQVPQTNGPLIADMSSCILSERLDMKAFDLIYAGAQKNIGPAGMTIVIVKRELFEQMKFDGLPKVFNYEAQAKNGSMLNTPPTFAWYLASLVFDWLQEQGGVMRMEELAKQKSQLVYDCIDEDDFFTNPIAVKDRSMMNIPFFLKNESLSEKFLIQAQEAKLMGLKGHRSLGGMRVSLYNSVPLEGAQALVKFMREFKTLNG
ncbi:3-phosphoserine/phosphohydroxythreonine transaminase [Aliikangiella coralliicola]|uniref:Phosphoserine aminotransferase n=1 Tax=Aliikangiella coralliicola TaxID=2592383 RepID=A0A545U4V7_9GAMM|nr:3-phosphoserine/phosphohydroxythreonine transaminase [Aliikangiella coralliicola]TQV84507.1 3-phosphoserine/phosphohydroxythreonine transaminase [Aliikangiella coralliicola]